MTSGLTKTRTEVEWNVMSVMEHLDSTYERDELTGLLSMDGIIHYIQSITDDTLNLHDHPKV